MKKVAIIGSQGVPAKYGGFETLVENIIGENTSPGINYTVFCSSRDFEQKLKSYRGARLKYIPLRANGIQSTAYDILSLFKVINGYDAVLLLGTSGCIALPFFRLFFHKKLLVNIDGLEHKREKWSALAKGFLRLSERLAIKYADSIITDNKGIQLYIKEKYGMSSQLIAYGSDHAERNVSLQRQYDILEDFRVKPGEYCLKVSRIEPENNCRMILDSFAFTGATLVYVGNWNRNNYGKELKNIFSIYPNIQLFDSIYDLDKLYALRKNCKFYIHGHSAGGTNPSLVEAMRFGRPVLTYDVIYNKETTEYKASYFHNSDELAMLISSDEIVHRENGNAMAEIARRRYTWNQIARQYEELY